MLSRQHVPRDRNPRSLETAYEGFGSDRHGTIRDPHAVRQNRYDFNLPGGRRHYYNRDSRFGQPEDLLFPRRRSLADGLGGIGSLGGLAARSGLRRPGALSGGVRGMGMYTDSSDGYPFGDCHFPASVEGVGGYSVRRDQRIDVPFGRASLGTSPLLDIRLPRRRDRLIDDLGEGLLLSPNVSRDSLLSGRGLLVPDLGPVSRPSRVGSLRSARSGRDINLLRLERGYGNYQPPYVEDYESVIDELERERLLDDIEFMGLIELRAGYSNPDLPDDYHGDGLDYLRALGY